MSEDEVDPALVRTALDRAVEVARAGEQASPVVPAPRELARYLDFQKLTGPARAVVLRVLDRDEAFRARVLAATEPGDVDAAGWLALTRPPGWEEVVGALAEGQEGASSSHEAERRLRDLQRGLEASERKRGLAEAELSRSREDVDAAQEELAAVRRERRRVEDALTAAERRVVELDDKVGDRETRLAEAQGAREAREHELAETRRLLDDARSELERRPAPLVPGERAVDVAALREAVSRLQRAAATLARSVEGVADAVPPEPVMIDDGGGPAPARTPLTLPGGVVADTAEGARWLLAQPGVVVLVDGYNVAKRTWPDDGLEAQRSRLIRALDELSARTGAPVEIVFDGPEDAAPAGRQGTRSVGVRYSGGALADDVVVDLVDAYPVDRPVVVVSSDLEVRDGARTRGASVIGSDTLAALFT